MALIRNKDLSNMPKDELKSKLDELRKELVKENAQIAIGTAPKSPGKVKQMKKTIAKILQSLNSMEVKENK